MCMCVSMCMWQRHLTVCAGVHLRFVENSSVMRFHKWSCYCYNACSWLGAGMFADLATMQPPPPLTNSFRNWQPPQIPIKVHPFSLPIKCGICKIEMRCSHLLSTSTLISVGRTPRGSLGSGKRPMLYSPSSSGEQWAWSIVVKQMLYSYRRKWWHQQPMVTMVTDLHDGGVEGIEIKQENKSIIKSFLWFQHETSRVGRFSSSLPSCGLLGTIMLGGEGVSVSVAN